MSMKVVWEDKAIESLGDIYDYLFDNAGEQVAEKATDIISESVNLLGSSPYMGVANGSNKERRTLIISKVSYVVPYEIDLDNDTVKVLDVIYQKKQR